MRKVRALLPLLITLGLFVIAPQITRAETLPVSESIGDITGATPTPSSSITPAATLTAIPEALPNAGTSSTLFFTLLFVLLLSGGTYFATSSRRS